MKAKGKNSFAGGIGGSSRMSKGVSVTPSLTVRLPPRLSGLCNYLVLKTRTSVLMSFGLALLASAVVGEARAQSPQHVAPVARAAAEEVLTNASIVKLARARFGEKTIIAIIRSRPSRFDHAPDRLIELKKGGVSERIILEMLAHDGAAVAATAADDDSVSDAFDDPFFGGMKSPERRTGTNQAGGAAAGDPGEINIFGSNTGARSSTRTSGGNGGAEGEQQSTGSATVRIIRPPTEAGGGAPPKLERTPTLTNDTIIELIAAGFSEGTILRRIEQSPADYDFAPAKLAELRRRRVTEPMITAMRAAMGEEANGQTSSPGGMSDKR